MSKKPKPPQAKHLSDRDDANLRLDCLRMATSGVFESRVERDFQRISQAFPSGISTHVGMTSDTALERAQKFYAWVMAA